MILDAVVLAGGRSSRLGGAPKAALVVEGRTLLERTLDAVGAARSVVVVGDPEVVAAAAPRRAVRATREQPAFAGPAAGIAAGLSALLAAASPAPDRVLVLACDMPHVAAAVEALLASDAAPALAVSPDGRRQQLVGVLPTAALARAIRRHRHELEGLSVRALYDGLDAVGVAVPPGTTDDIDTVADAEALGIRLPDRRNPMSESRDETDETLRRWRDALVARLAENDPGFADAGVDIDGVLGLAGKVAHAVVRPAAPLTAYVVGLAVGRAVAAGADPATAYAEAVSAARDLAASFEA